MSASGSILGNAVLQENNFDLFRPPTSVQDILDGTAWRGGGQQFRLEAYPGTQFSYGEIAKSYFNKTAK